MNPTTVIPLLIAIAVVFVLLPVAIAVYRFYRVPRTVRCPRLRTTATVSVDPQRAALAAVLGSTALSATACSLLAARPGCRTECLTGAKAGARA
jgi:peptidoglycan/LPS O-acetylase OafA/YrhL